MEGIRIAPASRCPCCANMLICEGFQKLLELKDIGVIIYCHHLRKDDVNEAKDMVLIHNRTNMKISSAEALQEIDKNRIPCPRCKQKIQHAQELLKKVPTIDKSDVMTVCDHCRLEALSEEPCNKCAKILKGFLSAYGKPKEHSRKTDKLWRTEFKDIPQDITIRSRSEVDIDILKSEFPKSVGKPMFHSEENIYKTGEKLRKIRSDTKATVSYKDERISDTEEKQKRMRQYDVYKETKPPSLVTPEEKKSQLDQGKMKAVMGSASKAPKILKSEQREKSEQRDKSEQRHKSEHKEKTGIQREKGDQKEKGERKEKYVQKEKTGVQREKSAPKEKTERKEKTGVQREKSAPKEKTGVQREKSTPKAKTGVQREKSPPKEKTGVQGEKSLRKEKSVQKEKSAQTEKSEQKEKSGVQKEKRVQKEKSGVEKEKSVQKAKSERKEKNDQKEKATERSDKLEKTKPSKQEKIKEKLPKEEAPIIEKKSDGEKRKNVPDDLAAYKKLQSEREKKQKEEASKKDRSKQPAETEDLSKTKQTNEEKLLKKGQSKDDKSTQLGKDEGKQSETAKKKAKENVRQAKAEIKPEPVRPAEKTKIDEKPKHKDLEITKVKLLRPSTDNLLLNLIKLKQTDAKKAKHPSPTVDTTKMFEKVKKVLRDVSVGSICKDSLSDLDIKSFEDKMHRKGDWEDIVIGEHLAKYQPPYAPQQVEEHGDKPIFFQSKYLDEAPFIPSKNIADVQERPVEKHKADPDKKGIMHYALSDRTFIEKGWTMLPTEKVVRKMNVYRMRPAHPEFDWFEHNKNKREMEYDTGEKLAEINDNGRGRWYYKNGQVALDYYDAEETNAQQRFVVYSSGQPDERGRCHPITILATFDYLGNGIVFDHAGKIRIKYNQTEGVLLDRSIGPVTHWKWHSLNDPPILQQVMIDTQMAHKDPTILKFEGSAKKTIPDNEDMLAIEFDNFIKEKSKKLSQKFKPFQIKMKALKINEQFSLRVLDQATVYLIFRDGSTNIKLNIGMVLDHQEIVDTDIAELGKVSNNLERFPARTDSLAEMQRNIAFAQRYERFHTERERRLRPPEPCGSADKLVAAASRPLRRPLTTITATPGGSASNCKCSRKPSSNLYYNTRLM